MINFKKLGLSDNTIKAIKEFGIESPTAVQEDVIPLILAGKDVLTIAPIKCGKTTSFVFPLVDIISKHKKQNILIITPTSKHSITVSDKFAIFNKYHEINETIIQDKEEDIDNEANVIIGSPELLAKLVDEKKIDLSEINILIVDDINIIKRNKQLENLEKILDVLPAEKQNIVYTNRRSKDTQDILDKILKTPEEVRLTKKNEKEIEQLSKAKAQKASYEKPVETKKEDEKGKIEKVDNQKVETTKVETQKIDNQKPLENNKNNDNNKPKENNISQTKNNKSEENTTKRFIPSDTTDKYASRIADKNKSFGGKVPNFILQKGIVARIDNE